LVKGLRPALALPRGIGSHEESRCAEGAPRRFIQENERPLHGNVQRLFCALQASERSSPNTFCENVQHRIFSLFENIFAHAKFGFVQNGKIYSKNSIFAGGIGGWTAKYIITSRGEIPVIKE